MFLTARRKTFIGLVLTAVFIAFGIFVWAFKTGKIGLRAEPVGIVTVSGKITNIPSDYTLSQIQVRVFGSRNNTSFLHCQNYGWTSTGCFYGLGGIDAQGNYSIAAQSNANLDGPAKLVINVLYEPWVGSYDVAGTALSNIQQGQTISQDLAINTAHTRIALVYRSAPALGMVVDDDNFQPLGGVELTIATGERVTTDSSGHFSATQPCDVSCVNIGFTSITKQGYTAPFALPYYGSQLGGGYPFYLISLKKSAKTLSGTIKGQDSDSGEQVPLELAKVTATVNGKNYHTRTNQNGQYLLDFSDQATLPTTIDITATQDLDSYDSQTQPVTLSATSAVTQDFVLGRSVQKQWVSGLTDLNTVISYDESLQNSTGPVHSLFPTARAAQSWVIRGRIIDSDTKSPIPGAQVALDPITLGELPTQQVTTDSNGEYTFTTSIQSQSDLFYIYAWKSNEYLIYEFSYTPALHLSYCRAVGDSDCVSGFSLQRLSSTALIGGIRFDIYGGQEVISWTTNNWKILARIATEVANIKKDFKINVPKHIAIYKQSVDFDDGPTAVDALGFSNLATSITWPLYSLQQDTIEKIAAQAIHEAGHIVLKHRITLNNNLIDAQNAHLNQCSYKIPRSIDDTDCSFTPVKDGTYIGDVRSGHPWDNYSELFASSLAIQKKYLSTGGRFLIFLRYPGFLQWMEKTDYSSKKKNANKFIMDYIETLRQQINGETPHKTIFGTPLNLSKTYSVQDILAGSYP